MAKAQPKYRLNIDWMPTDEDYLFVEVHRPDITRQHLEQIIKEFRAYWMNRLDAKGEKRAQDWKAAWRNWIMKVVVRPSYAQRPHYESEKDRSRRIAFEQLTGGSHAGHIIDI